MVIFQFVMTVCQRLWWMNMNRMLQKNKKNNWGCSPTTILLLPHQMISEENMISPPDQWGMASSHLNNISQLHLMIIASRDGNWYTNYSMWNHQPNVDCLQYMFISIRCHATSGCGYAYGMLIESTKNERERECVTKNMHKTRILYIYIQCVYIWLI